VSPFWLDGRPRIGMHTSIAGDASQALEIAWRIGCTALQIFSGSPRMWPRPHQRAMRPEVAERFRARRAELCLGPLAVHANYLINLASLDPALWQRSLAAFGDELHRAAQLGAEFLILHPGSARGGDPLQAIESVAEGIARASRMLPAEFTAPQGGVRVLVENTAGQGAALGSRLEELQQILNACRARGVLPLPGVCLDTAHLLAAGYEIRTPEGLQRTLEEVDAAVGLENVCVIHVNDSKAPLAARVDRHEHIGRGHIGRSAFALILNHPRLRDSSRAFLLETPVDHPGDDRKNVRALWTLLGLHAPPMKRKAASPITRRTARKGSRRSALLRAKSGKARSRVSGRRRAQNQSSRKRTRSPR
jgi:deoxyribonuclease-4